MNDTANEIVNMIKDYIKKLEENNDLDVYPKGIAKTALTTTINLIKKQYAIEGEVEYIKREDVVELISSLKTYAWTSPISTESHMTVDIEALLRGISKIPNADVVEVVRCKECTWCEDMGISGLYCRHPDHRNPIYCLPSDYCNNGNRNNNTNK